MNIGNPTRTLALVEPQRDTFLPVDDQAWEQGVCIGATNQLPSHLTCCPGNRRK